MIIYDKEFCRIEFDKDKGVLSQHWNGFADELAKTLNI